LELRSLTARASRRANAELRLLMLTTLGLSSTESSKLWRRGSFWRDRLRSLDWRKLSPLLVLLVCGYDNNICLVSRTAI
jgi:hypothetical protein